MSRGIILIGIGGSGRAVVDGALKLVGNWRQEGVVVRLIDVIGDDDTAVMPPGAACIDPGSAEDRFVMSGADCEPVVLSARKNGAPPEFPWLDTKTAEAVTPPTPGTGAGGDRIASYIIATLGRASIGNALASAVSEATGQIAEEGRVPTAFVIAGGAGGVGSGHMIPVIRELQHLTNRDIDLVPIMLSGAYTNRMFRDESKRNQAWERAIALQRELDLFGKEELPIKFIVGGGPDAYANSAPAQGVIAATSLWLASIIRNQATYSGARPNWAGTDLRDAKPAERHSTIGASRIAYRADLFADWLAKTMAAEAWEMVTKPSDEALSSGAKQALGLLDRTAIGSTANKVHQTPAIQAVVQAQLEEDATETLMGALNPSDEFPQVIDFDTEVGDTLPRLGGVTQPELFDMANRYSIDLREELADYVKRGRRDWRIELTEFLRVELDEAFSGGGNGFIVGSDPQQLVRVSTTLRTIAETFNGAADRIAKTRDQIEEELKPVRAAEDRVDEEARELDNRVNRREAKDYLEARRWLAYCERWRAVCGAAIELCRDLASTSLDAAQPLESWLGYLSDFAAGARQAAGDVERTFNDLDLRPSLELVPSPRTEAFTRFGDELRMELLEVTKGVSPPQAALEELRWRADLPPNAIEQWGLRMATPRVSEHTPAQDGWVYNSGAALPKKVSVIAPSFLWEMIERGASGGIGLRSVAERFSLYDAMAAEYRMNFAPQNGGVVTPELVRRFCATFRDRMFDTSGALAPYDSTKPDGGQAARPIEHIYYFLDPSPTRRTDTDPDDGPSLSEQIRDALLDGLGKSEQDKQADGDPREFTRLTVVNGIHTDLFQEVRPHLDHYYDTIQPVHPLPAVATARAIEKVLKDQRRIDGRLLDTEVVRLLEHAPELRALGQMLALGIFDAIDDPNNPAAKHQLYRVDATRAGRAVTVDLGTTQDPVAVIRTALIGGDADIVRPLIRETFAEKWPTFVEGHESRADALRALHDAVYALEFPPTETGVDPHDLQLAIAVLATEDVSF